MLLRHLFVVIGMFCLLSPQFVGAEEVEEKENFNGSISLGGESVTGNSPSSVFDGQLDLSYENFGWRSAFSFQATQKTENNVLTSDYYEAILKETYDLGYHVYGLLQLGYREDFFEGIYSEKSYVLGLGYHFFSDMPDVTLDIELGHGERIQEKVSKISLDYDPGTHVALIAEYQWSEDDLVHLQLSGEFGNDDDFTKESLSWTHHLFQDLSLDMSYERRALSKPQIGTLGVDAAATLKLGYSF